MCKKCFDENQQNQPAPVEYRMANAAAIGRCPNCALLSLQPQGTVEPRTARVEELLRQNHPPLDIELSTFRKVAKDTRNAVKDLDSKIFKARELLKNLLSARKETKSRLEDAKSILHPMRSIPSELLVEIFLLCVPTAYRAKAPDVLDPRGAPWLLTGVCSRWRKLVLHTPQLWTHLLLDFNKHVGHITDHQCAYKVGLFVERSRGLPMDVFLGSTDPIANRSVIPALEVSIPRWRSLHVDMTRASLQSFSGNNFVSLQTLRLRLQSDTPNLRVDVFQPKRTPVLRDFELVPSQSWRSLEHVSLPWSRLTSVARFPVFDAEAVHYLHTMTELTRLHVLVDYKTRIPHYGVISLPKLRQIIIFEGEGAAGLSQEFFRALAVPALSDLALKYDIASALHFPASPLSLNKVTSLDITCEMNAHEENTRNLLNFLALTPNVEFLRIYDLNMTLEFVDGLNPDKTPRTTPLRLPYLLFLDIHRCRFAPALHNDVDQLFEMIFSRLVQTHDQSPPANGTGEEVYTRPRGEQYRCLKKVQIPRWLYIQMGRDPSPLFSYLTAFVQLEGIS